MRNCPSCQHELEQLAIVRGQCPHCGAILRKLSQRTFEDKRLPAGGSESPSENSVDEFDLDEFIDLGQSDTDPGSRTVEISGTSFEDDEPSVNPDDITPLEEGNVFADLTADVTTSDPSDAFILGESIDLELIDDDAIGQTIEISDVVLDGDKMSLDIDDMTPLEDEQEPFLSKGDAAIDYISDASLDLNLSNIEPPAVRAEGSAASNTDLHDEEPQVDDDDITPLEEVATEDRKSPTIEYTSDKTMEFQTLADAAAMQSGTPASSRPTRQSTYSPESDKTIDLSMSPADSNLMDSQWRGTFELGTRQGQTIRQRETVTGYRSSLPVKSRYVREKRPEPAAAPQSLSKVPDYELLDIIG